MSKSIRSIEDIDPKYAKSYSEDNFWEKVKNSVKRAGLELIYRAIQLFYVMQKPDCPIYIKGGIIAALGYFISPLDIIPDFIPFVGYTDDWGVILVAVMSAQLYIDDEVKRKARKTIDNIFGKGTSDGLD